MDLGNNFSHESSKENSVQIASRKSSLIHKVRAKLSAYQSNDFWKRDRRKIVPGNNV